MEVRLEPSSADNIGDVLANARTSYSAFYYVPWDEAQAEQHLSEVARWRREGKGDEYLAYDAAAEGRQFVGNGQIYNEAPDSCSIAYWVVREQRKRGFGRAIVAALEECVMLTYPEVSSLTAYVDLRNSASKMFAAAIGFTLVETDRESGLYVYRKRLQSSANP